LTQAPFSQRSPKPKGQALGAKEQTPILEETQEPSGQRTPLEQGNKGLHSSYVETHEPSAQGNKRL
jgi:hypothetical protein